VTAKYKHVSIVITATDQFSDPIKVQEGRRIHLSAFGTFVATLELQIRFNFSKDTDWRTWVTTTAELEDHTLVNAVDCEIRVGSTAHTSGSPLLEARVSREKAST